MTAALWIDLQDIIEQSLGVAAVMAAGYVAIGIIDAWRAKRRAKQLAKQPPHWLEK